MQKLVTIGIPFFNSQLSLENSIKSVVAQTYKNLEIILIDDGSTDSSLGIAEKFSSMDTRIKVVKDGKNLGLIARLNQLIQISNGHYFARMDSDDLMFPTRIEEQVSFLEDHPDTDVVSTGFVSINSKLIPQGTRNCLKDKPEIFNFFKNGDNILHPSVMARLSWFKANLYDSNFERAEDRELFCRTLGKSKFYNMTKPLMFYMDVQNLTLSKYLRSYVSERKVLDKHWEGNLSFIEYVSLKLRSLLKSVVIRIFFFFKIQDSLISQKNSQLSPDEFSHYTNQLNEIIGPKF